MQVTNNCINWTGAKNKAGYGITWFQNKWAYAHRAVTNALKGQVVRHSCDNPSCVNPEHLVVGTAKENSEDMVTKGRQIKGTQSHLAKLDEDTVQMIRMAKGGMSSRQCADRFNISKTNVLDIWNNKIWKHV